MQRADQAHLVPTILTPDGRTALVLATVPERSWDVVTRQDGVDLVFAGRGDMTFLSATDGTPVLLGEGSEATLHFTLALDRDADGRLELTDLRGARMQVTAFAEDGARIV